MEIEQNKQTEDKMLAVRKIIPSCTRTDIGREISNFSGTYCTVEQNTVSFSHPSIYDAAACSLGKLNIVLLLKYCSLRFLFERVRINKFKSLLSSEPDAVTNMIYIDTSLYSLVGSRIVEGIRRGHFSMTVNHPILGDRNFATRVLSDLREHLPKIITQIDSDTGNGFLYWASLSDSHLLFVEAIDSVKNMMQTTPESSTIPQSTIDNLYEALESCVHEGKLEFLQDIVGLLGTVSTWNVNFRTNEDETFLIIASKACQLKVFKFLLHEGADILLTNEIGLNCLHFTAIEGSIEITKVILDEKPDMIHMANAGIKTPAMICAQMGHAELLQFLVSRGAALILKDVYNTNCLHIASAYGQHSVVEYLLSLENSGIDINSRTKNDLRSSVVLAAEFGHYDVYNLLVSRGADLVVDGENDMLMLRACVGGNVSIVRHLLSMNLFDINIRFYCSNGNTPVMIAAQHGHFDLYNYLVSQGADVCLTVETNNCLMLACEGGNASVVKHLLSLNTFDVNKGNLLYRTPLRVAIEEGHFEVYKLLLTAKADFSPIDLIVQDCLVLACKGGNMSILKHLLSQKEFDINRRSVLDNQKAIMMAIEEGHHDVFKLLVLKGADLSGTDEENRDCLMLACWGGNISIVKQLLSLKTFDIDRRGGTNNQTPVMMATEEGHYDVFKHLVSEGANLSCTDDDNRDCLLQACKRGNVSILKYLLLTKAFDIEEKGGFSNKTPVMVAAEEGHFGVFKHLVTQGADLSRTDVYNRDCLMIACKGGDVSIVEYLLLTKAFDIEKKGGFNNKTPVMVAAEGGHYDVFKHLVSQGADLFRTDDLNRDCLMLASKGGNVSIVKHLLLTKAFDIEKKGGFLIRTPVMVAAEEGPYGVFKYLVSEGADLSLTAENNRDCLDLAWIGGNLSIVTYLMSLKTFKIKSKDESFEQMCCGVITSLLFAKDREWY